MLDKTVKNPVQNVYDKTNHPKATLIAARVVGGFPKVTLNQIDLSD